LARLRYSVPKCVLLSLYHALIEPYFTYCNIVWALQQTTCLKSLFVCQKKALRIISFSQWQAHAHPLFVKYRLLTVYQINKLQVGCFMYMAMQSMIPLSFTNMYTLNSSIHSYNTRGSNDIHVMRYRTNLIKHSIRIQGIYVWNELADTLKSLPTVTSFRNRLKFMLSNII
jgi:hypothetical protein